MVYAERSAIEMDKYNTSYNRNNKATWNVQYQLSLVMPKFNIYILVYFKISTTESLKHYYLLLKIMSVTV